MESTAFPEGPLPSARVVAYHREWWEKWLTRDQASFDNAWLDEELTLVARERRNACEWWAKQRKCKEKVALHERKRKVLNAWLDDNCHALGPYVNYKDPAMKRQLAEWVQELGVSREELVHFIRRKLKVRRCGGQYNLLVRPRKPPGESSWLAT